MKRLSFWWELRAKAADDRHCRVRVPTASPVRANMGTGARGSQCADATYGESISNRGAGEPHSQRIIVPRPVDRSYAIRRTRSEKVNAHAGFEPLETR